MNLYTYRRWVLCENVLSHSFHWLFWNFAGCYMVWSCTCGFCKKNKINDFSYFLVHFRRMHTWPYSVGRLRRRPSANLSVRFPHSSNFFSSETTGPIKAKFLMEPSWAGGMEVYSLHPGNMIKIVAMFIYVKIALKIFFSGTKEPLALGLGMQFWGHKPNKVWKHYNVRLTWSFLQKSQFFSI